MIFVNNVFATFYLYNLYFLNNGIRKINIVCIYILKIVLKYTIACAIMSVYKALRLVALVGCMGTDIFREHHR